MSNENVFIDGIGIVPREVLLRNPELLIRSPELLSHEETMQRHHARWLAEAEARRRERARAELEKEELELELELEEDERIEGDAPISIHRHPRGEAEEARPPDFPKTREEAERESFHGEPGPEPSQATQEAAGRLGTLARAPGSRSRLTGPRVS